MKKVPASTHLLNFILKYSLFLIGFFLFSSFGLIKFPTTFLILIPLFFTLIGVVADWVIVPKFHNIPSAIAGAIFMGVVTYFIPIVFGVGSISLQSVIFLAIYLGIIEIILHRFIVKAYLMNP